MNMAHCTALGVVYMYPCDHLWVVHVGLDIKVSTWYLCKFSSFLINSHSPWKGFHSRTPDLTVLPARECFEDTGSWQMILSEMEILHSCFECSTTDLSIRVLSCSYTRQIRNVANMTGFQIRGTKTWFFVTFQTCHHFEPVRALDFWLGLSAVSDFVSSLGLLLCRSNSVFKCMHLPFPYRKWACPRIFVEYSRQVSNSLLLWFQR